MTFDILLPELPPSLNARMHWRQRHVLTRAARELTKLQARSALAKGLVTQASNPRHLRIEVVRGKGQARDTDNCVASMKGVIDGLVDAGVLRDDSDKWMTGLEVKQSKEANQSGIVLHITLKEAK